MHNYIYTNIIFIGMEVKIAVYTKKYAETLFILLMGKICSIRNVSSATMNYPSSFFSVCKQIWVTIWLHNWQLAEVIDYTRFLQEIQISVRSQMVEEFLRRLDKKRECNSDTDTDWKVVKRCEGLQEKYGAVCVC